MNAAALFFVTHGSSDRRSWSALQNLVNVVRSQSSSPNLHNHLISGGCLEGLELTLAQQLEQFAIEVFSYGCKEIVILPLFLLAGVHVSEDIPHEVAIAQSKLQQTLPQAFSQDAVKPSEQITFRITPHLGTHSQIPHLLNQHFCDHEYRPEEGNPNQTQGRILMAHGSRRIGANQVIEDLANQSQAIAAYWGVEPKIETQVENLIAQNIYRINVLPYFLTSGGITEAIAHKLSVYSDRAQVNLLPVPLSNQQIIDLAATFI
jgi:sirohydrochlorin cobaltochelatase